MSLSTSTVRFPLLILLLLYYFPSLVIVEQSKGQGPWHWPWSSEAGIRSFHHRYPAPICLGTQALFLSCCRLRPSSQDSAPHILWYFISLYLKLWCVINDSPTPLRLRNRTSYFSCQSMWPFAFTCAVILLNAGLSSYEIFLLWMLFKK